MIRRIRNACFVLLALTLLVQPVFAEDPTAPFKGDGPSSDAAIQDCQSMQNSSTCNAWCYADHGTSGNGQYQGCETA